MHIKLSGWQKAQIEKRRKEQIKQRKQHAKKKPLGDGINVESAIPVDFTKTGLKLKLDTIPTKQQQRQHRQEEKPVNERLWRANNMHLPINPVRRVKKAGDAVGAASVSEKLMRQSNVLSDTTEVNHKLRALSLSQRQVKPSANHTNDKRKSLIPKFTGGGNAARFSSDEGKENDNSFHHSENKATRTSHLKKPGPRKHFQLATDINSLKREHEQALEMLQDLDKIENRRRSLGSASSYYSFDSECTDRDIVEKANRRDILNEKNLSEEESGGSRQDECGELVSSSEIEPAEAIPEESFTWLPEGIKDASHLSIVLNDEIESQEDVDDRESVVESPIIDVDTGSMANSFAEQEGRESNSGSSSIAHSFSAESNGQSDVASLADDGQSFNSQSDEYLSDTSGY